jgi:hypothetical protein
MSTLHTNTVETSSGGPVTLTKQQACKSWIGVDQIGTQAIHESFNISSIADNAVGTTDINFTNNFSTVNYIATGADHYAGNSAGLSPYVGDPDQSSQTTSASLLQCYSTSATRDTSYVGYHAMGDLA